MPDRSFAFLDDQLVITEQEIMERACALPGDIVILSGTLVEGIGNKHSDIDLYVVGDELPGRDRVGPRAYTGYADGRVRAYYDYLESAGFGFDVEYYTRSEVADMKEAVLSLYNKARGGTKILRERLEDPTADALHKFRIGICLQQAEEYRSLFEDRFWAMLSFILYRNKTGGYPEFKDIMGAWGSGDYDTSLHIMREFVLNQTAALGHLTGMTNGRAKWVFQTIKGLPEEYQDIAKDVLRWLYTEKLTEEAKRTAVLDACDLIDRVYLADMEILDARAPLSFTPEEALELTAQELARENFHDRQTLAEFEHRRRLFSAEGVDMRTFFQANA